MSPPAGQPRWSEVDGYVAAALALDDPDLTAALQASAAAGLPPISVSVQQGRLLTLLAATLGATAILEIGTLGGYSAICLARALPATGRLVSLELLPRHAEVARANLARAGLAERVEIRVGKALETLPRLEAETRRFDLVFIDADKASIPDYFAWSLRLTRLGALIVVDNVVRGGAVADAASTDRDVQGVRRFLELAGREPRVQATAIQTVGSKGYDGFALLRVVS